MRDILLAALAASIYLAGMAALKTSECAAEPILGAPIIEDRSGDSTDTSLLADATARFKEGDYDGAMIALQDAVKKNPDMPPAELIMADLYLQSNMAAERKKAMEQALKNSPDDPETYAVMAFDALREGNPDKAEEFFQEAERRLAGFPKSLKRKELLQAGILNGLAVASEAREDWAEARRRHEAYLQLNPKDANAMQRLAYCLLRLKDPDAALARIREAAKIGAVIVAPEAVLAGFCEQSGDHAGAKRWMAAALDAAPKDLPTRLAAAQWAFDAKDLDEARSHAAAALRIDSKSISAQFLLGVIAMLKKEYETAEMYFAKVVKRQPDNMAFTNNLAMAMAVQDDESKRRQALEYAEANVKRFPKSADAASTYGYALYRLGRLEDAEKSLALAASIADADPDTAYIIARVAVGRGHKDKALRLLEGAVKNTKSFVFRQEAEELLEELKN